MEYTKDYFDQLTDRTGTFCAKYDSMSMFYPGDDLVPMWIADMEFRCPRELEEAMKKRVECNIYGYGELSGQKYHKYVVKWQRERNGIEYKEDDVFFGESALTGVRLAIHALAQEGEEVLMFLPTYGHFLKYVNNLKRTPVTPHLLHENGVYTIDFDDLDRTLDEHDVKLLIFCSPFNPVGRVWTQDEMAKLVEICKKHGVYIVSDEVHSDFVMPGHTFIPTAKVARELDYADHVITTQSISKTFNCAGINQGYYIIEGEELKQKIAASAEYFAYDEMGSAFSYLALTTVYEHGGPYVDALCSYVYENNQYMTERLKALPYADNIVISPMEGSYLAWIQLLNTRLKPGETCYPFVKYGVALEGEEQFHETDGRYFRFNLAAPRPIIEKAMDRVTACLDDLYGTQK